MDLYNVPSAKNLPLLHKDGRFYVENFLRYLDLCYVNPLLLEIFFSSNFEI